MVELSINHLKKFQELNILSVFPKFMIQSGAFSFIIGTTIGFGATNIIKSLKTDVLDTYVFNKFNLKDYKLINFFSTIIELVILVYILYLIYNYMFPDIYKLSVQKSEDEKKWKKEIITVLNDINNKLTK
jgi:hypothetical protein